MKQIIAAGLLLASITHESAVADSFSDTLVKTFPARVTLDPKAVRTLNWMEDQGWVQTYEHGDGGRVTIWVDDAGKQWCVQLGHDSIGVISDDPVVMMHFLAMGSLKPGAMDRTDRTPLEALLEYYGHESTAEFVGVKAETLESTVLQNYLTETFASTAPAPNRSKAGLYCGADQIGRGHGPEQY